jgi:hypothetical protein
MSQNRHTGSERPSKRVKLDHAGGFKFTSADEIRKSIQTQDQDSLITGEQLFTVVTILCPYL